MMVMKVKNLSTSRKMTLSPWSRANSQSPSEDTHHLLWNLKV